MREQQLHKNVKITYPSNKTDAVIVECYVGEYMNLFVGDPQITQYADANGEIKVEFRVVDRKTGDMRCSKATNVALDLLAKTAAEVIVESAQ